MLHYEDRLPHPALQPYIQYYGRMRIDRLASESVEHVLPSLGKGLVFWRFDNQPLRVENGTQTGEIPSAFIMGQGIRRAQWTHKGGVDGFAVIFRPGQLRKFLREDWAGMLNYQVSLTDADDRAVKELHYQIEESDTFTARCAHADAFFLRRLRSVSTDTDRIDAMIQYLHRHPGCRVEELAKAHHYSPRQLRRVFMQRLGISPKDYQKVYRVSLALSRLYRGDFVRLSDLAYDLGYCDQAHFIREFQYYMDVSPTTFLRNRQYTINVMNRGLAGELQ